MNLRVLIAEDEPLSRERLRRCLRAEPDMEIVAECATGTEALNAILQMSPDVVFLDVRMPELDGFGVLEALTGVRPPVIVFVTASDQFALRAFEANAVDYLLKPFERERFQTALRRARERLRSDPETQNKHGVSDLLARLEPQTKRLERLTVKSQGRISIVHASEIDWISAADNYVELHVGTRTHLMRMSIKTLADQLPRKQFVRISRSVLVNLSRVKEIRPKSHGDCLILLENGMCLTGSRNYRQHLAAFLRN